MQFTGERMIPEHNTGGTIYLEHITRYQFASQIAANKDILDIACGSGYGSYELATAGAKSIVGVDISAETVAYATEQYTHSNLRFKEGSATAIPLPDASVDLVVSFETIEHIDGEAQIKFMAEIKRVLRPDGTLIMSTPNVSVCPPGNEFHVKELTKDEYLGLLSLQFQNTKIYNQDSVESSFITDESHTVSQAKLDITPENCLYFVSVSSDMTLPQMALRINASSTHFWQEYINLSTQPDKRSIFSRLMDLKTVKNILGRIRRQLTRGNNWIEPGHFYSPITTDSNFQKFANRPGIPDIDLQTDGQLDILKKIQEYYPEQPFSDTITPGLRYYFENNQFGHGDATTLYSMLRLLKPKKIVEVGSGYSSAIMLDVNEKFMGNAMDLTFIEPYSERLRSLLKKSDIVNIIEQKVQDVDMNIFAALDEGDILFIDSSHVSKAGSDVNWLYFEVLPTLKKGVHIHIHDIMYPFEYHDAWIEQGRSWNEAYLVRALLMNNPNYAIFFWGDYLYKFYPEQVKSAIPLMAKNPGGSLWIHKK